jgi:hypothetical protein
MRESFSFFQINQPITAIMIPTPPVIKAPIILPIISKISLIKFQVVDRHITQKLPVISKRILIGGWILKPRVPHSKMEIADRPKLANNIKLEGVPT